MAAGVPPHVTLVYPEEVDDESLLVERATEAGAVFGEFSMACESVVVDGDDGRGGVFVTMSDPSSSWGRLRAHLLAPPLQPIDAQPHMTIVHPRTSERGREAWTALATWRPTQLVVAREFALTVTSAEQGMRIVERFALQRRDRALCVGVLLVDQGCVLLAKRSAAREWFPGIWDICGGHVEIGEALRAAAVREVGEELGIAVDADDLTHVGTIATDEYELVAFAADRWHGEPVNAAPHEHDKIAWCAVERIGALALADKAIGQLAKRAFEACR